MSWTVAGDLAVQPATERTDLLADAVRAALTDTQLARCAVVEIDPAVADTAVLVEAHGVYAKASANCVVVTGRRSGEPRWAGCVVLATTRADVNGVVRKRLDVRKASFADQQEAVRHTGMEYGGITPIGLPDSWPVLLDPAVAESAELVIGSGLRRSKLLVPGELLAGLPRAAVLDGLGR